jgi:hypothetical protein
MLIVDPRFTLNGAVVDALGNSVTEAEVQVFCSSQYQVSAFVDSNGFFVIPNLIANGKSLGFLIQTVSGTTAISNFSAPSVAGSIQLLLQV